MTKFHRPERAEFEDCGYARGDILRSGSDIYKELCYRIY